MWKILLAVAAVVVDVHPADACSCVGPHVSVMGSRRDRKMLVPRNAQIRIEWPARDVKLDETTIALVSTAKSGPPANIAVDRKSFTTGEVRNAVLTPKLPLVASTTYQIVASETKGAKTFVIDEVTATDVVDDSAPTWKGAATAQLIHAPAICCNCTTGDPYVSVEAGPDAADDKSPEDTIVFGVWAASAKFDPKAPMLALREAYQGKFVLGRASMCSASGFDVPTTGKTLELWVAPIDLAGNIGTPAKVTIDLTKPLTTRPSR